MLVETQLSQKLLANVNQCFTILMGQMQNAPICLTINYLIFKFKRLDFCQTTLAQRLQNIHDSLLIIVSLSPPICHMSQVILLIVVDLAIYTPPGTRHIFYCICNSLTLTNVFIQDSFCCKIHFLFYQAHYYSTSSFSVNLILILHIISCRSLMTLVKLMMIKEHPY